MQETQETLVQSLDSEDPLKKEMATHSSILAWKTPHGQKILAGCSPWGCKESDTLEHTKDCDPIISFQLDHMQRSYFSNKVTGTGAWNFNISGEGHNPAHNRASNVDPSIGLSIYSANLSLFMPSHRELFHSPA